MLRCWDHCISTSLRDIRLEFVRLPRRSMVFQSLLRGSCCSFLAHGLLWAAQSDHAVSFVHEVFFMLESSILFFIRNDDGRSYRIWRMNFQNGSLTHSIQMTRPTSPYRVIHFAFIALLATRLLPVNWSGLQCSILQPLIKCGEQSLHVFVQELSCHSWPISYWSQAMAYEFFNNLGESRGYKPIFKIDYPSKQEGSDINRSPLFISAKTLQSFGFAVRHKPFVH